MVRLINKEELFCWFFYHKDHEICSENDAVRYLCKTCNEYVEMTFVKFKKAQLPNDVSKITELVEEYKIANKNW